MSKNYTNIPLSTFIQRLEKNKVTEDTVDLVEGTDTKEDSNLVNTKILSPNETDELLMWL